MDVHVINLRRNGLNTEIANLFFQKNANSSEDMTKFSRVPVPLTSELL